MNLTVRNTCPVHVLFIRLIASFGSSSDLYLWVLIQEFLRHVSETREMGIIETPDTGNG